MKRFFQTKAGATYHNGCSYTIAIRKDVIEYYSSLNGKWHAVVNIEWYTDAVRIIIRLGDFAEQLFGKVILEGINTTECPNLGKLLFDKKYTIIDIKTGSKPETQIHIDVEKKFDNFFEALADKEVRQTIKETISFFISLHNELLHSSSSLVKPLHLTFYEE